MWKRGIILMSTGDAIREREFFFRKREQMTKSVVRDVRKLTPKESSLSGNTTPCQISLPKNGKKSGK